MGPAPKAWVDFADVAAEHLRAPFQPQNGEIPRRAALPGTAFRHSWWMEIPGHQTASSTAGLKAAAGRKKHLCRRRRWGTTNLLQVCCAQRGNMAEFGGAISPRRRTQSPRSQKLTLSRGPTFLAAGQHGDPFSHNRNKRLGKRKPLDLPPVARSSPVERFITRRPKRPAKRRTGFPRVKVAGPLKARGGARLAISGSVNRIERPSRSSSTRFSHGIPIRRLSGGAALLRGRLWKSSTALAYLRLAGPIRTTRRGQILRVANFPGRRAIGAHARSTALQDAGQGRADAESVQCGSGPFRGKKRAAVAAFVQPSFEIDQANRRTQGLLAETVRG